MNDYELMVLADPKKEEVSVKSIFKKLLDTLTRFKATNIKEDYWGKKHLAYEIEGSYEGIYTVFSFSMDPSRVLKLKEELNLNEEIARYLLTKVK